MKIADQPVSSDQTLTQPSDQAGPNQKSGLLVILGIIILLLVAGGIYDSVQKKPLPPSVNQRIAPISQTVSPTKTSALQPVILANGWIVKSSRYCGVKFTAPPNKAPYFELIGKGDANPENRRFWQLREGAQQANGHNIFLNNSSLIYIADSEANGYADIQPNDYTEAGGYKPTKGYVAGLVGVQCAPKGTYSTDNIAESYAASYGSAGITVKSKRIMSQWGKDVVAATFEGGSFKDHEIYFVVTDNTIYKIEKRSDSDKALVKSTTDQIFNSLQFPN